MLIARAVRRSSMTCREETEQTAVRLEGEESARQKLAEALCQVLVNEDVVSRAQLQKAIEAGEDVSNMAACAEGHRSGGSLPRQPVGPATRRVKGRCSTGQNFGATGSRE